MKLVSLTSMQVVELNSLKGQLAEKNVELQEATVGINTIREQVAEAIESQGKLQANLEIARAKGEAYKDERTTDGQLGRRSSCSPRNLKIC